MKCINIRQLIIFTKCAMNSEPESQLPNMLVKITAIALMAVTAASKGEQVWDGYSAKWSEDPADGFYQLPQNMRDAEAEGWTEISGVGAPHNARPLGYYGDPRLTIFYANCTGEVIGHQVGFPMADIENSGIQINYGSNSAMTIKTLNGEKYYTGTALYYKDERRNTRQLWLEVNGTFVEIPTRAELITRETSYYSKRCVTWMGHHFYKITPTMDCSNIFPWALLMLEGELVGVAFQALGTAGAAPERTWFEHAPLAQLAYTIPDGPACLNESLAEYGAISLHVWFRKNPLAITCMDECTAVYNSTSDSGRERPEYYSQSGKRYKRALGSANVCPV